MEILHALHGSLTEGTLDDPSAAGRFRTGKDPIIVVDESDGQTLHVPPPARELPQRMEKFLAFANDKGTEPFVHPVVRAILLHFWFAYEHPYVDGNGRTARAVFYWYMSAHNYWLFEYLSVSRIILKSVRQYGRAYLYAEHEDRDATYFLVYHLKAIHLALEDLHRYLARKQKEMQKATTLSAINGIPDSSISTVTPYIARNARPTVRRIARRDRALDYDRFLRGYRFPFARISSRSRFASASSGITATSSSAYLIASFALPWSRRMDASPRRTSRSYGWRRYASPRTRRAGSGFPVLVRAMAYTYAYRGLSGAREDAFPNSATASAYRRCLA